MMKAPNLRDATLQVIFDFVMKHLFTQNRRSCVGGKENSFCAFRATTEDGTCLMCALGPFIPDDKYERHLELARMDSLFPVLELIDEDWYHINSPFYRKFNLLNDLQTLHDKHRVCEWHLQAAKIANRYGLQFT